MRDLKGIFSALLVSFKMAQLMKKVYVKLSATISTK